MEKKCKWSGHSKDWSGFEFCYYNSKRSIVLVEGLRQRQEIYGVPQGSIVGPILSQNSNKSLLDRQCQPSWRFKGLLQYTTKVLIHIEHSYPLKVLSKDYMVPNRASQTRAWFSLRVTTRFLTVYQGESERPFNVAPQALWMRSIHFLGVYMCACDEWWREERMWGGGSP